MDSPDIEKNIKGRSNHACVMMAHGGDPVKDRFFWEGRGTHPGSQRFRDAFRETMFRRADNRGPTLPADS